MCDEIFDLADQVGVDLILSSQEKLLQEFDGIFDPKSTQGEGTGGIWGPHEGVYGQMSILNSRCKDLNRLKLKVQRRF